MVGMAGIPADYVSVNLRKSFLFEDHPDAEVQMDSCSAADLGIPVEFHDDKKFHPFFVRATITIPGRKPVIGWKEVPRQVKRDSKWVDAVLDPETFRKLGTNALGRALKDAGYPDKMPEFSAVVTWRKRNAELAALRSGTVAELGAGPSIEEALVGAAVPMPDAEHPDDDGDETIMDAEVVDEKPPTVAEVRNELADRIVAESSKPIPAAPPPNVDRETGEVGAITTPFNDDTLTAAWELLTDESQEALRKNLMGRGLWRAITKAADRKLVLAMLKSGRVKTQEAPAAPVAADPAPPAATVPTSALDDASALWGIVDNLIADDETVGPFVEHWLAENKTTRETATVEQVDALLTDIENAPAPDEPF